MAKFIISHRLPYTSSFSYDLKTDDGEIILSSCMPQGTRSGCKNCLKSVRVNSQIAARYWARVSEDKKFFYWLNAINGTTIGETPKFDTEEQRLAHMARVKAIAPEAEVEDLTI